MKQIKPINQQEQKIYEQMKKLSAEIGMNRIQRHTGEYIAQSEIRKKQKAFARLDKQYRKLKISL